MEPHFKKGDEPHLVGAERLDRLEPEARQLIEDWVCDVANDVEHKIWQEIVHYTKERGRGLVKEGRVSEETRFGQTRAFSQQAARVAKILVEELDERAHGGA